MRQATAVVAADREQVRAKAAVASRAKEAEVLPMAIEQLEMADCPCTRWLVMKQAQPPAQQAA